jgi:hypothetical protein
MEQAQRVGPDAVEVDVRRDYVAARLRHRASPKPDHSLTEQLLERLPELTRSEPGVAESTGVKARVEKVQDCMGDTADVLIDGHEMTGETEVDRRVLFRYVAKPEEVPR